MLRNKTCRGLCRLLSVRVNFDANKMYISNLSISNGYLQNLEHYWGVCFMLKLTWVRRIQNCVSCVSNVLCILMHGFFGNIQYAAIAPSIFTMKLPKHRCLECSTCAIFLSSSFTVSMIALLRNNNLSETLINAPFMLLLSLVISCMPSTKSFWKSPLLTIPCHQRVCHTWTP